MPASSPISAWRSSILSSLHQLLICAGKTKQRKMNRRARGEGILVYSHLLSPYLGFVQPTRPSEMIPASTSWCFSSCISFKPSFRCFKRLDSMTADTAASLLPFPPSIAVPAASLSVCSYSASLSVIWSVWPGIL